MNDSHEDMMIHIDEDFVAPTQDPMGIGPTRGQRSAEIVAGIRALLMGTPEAMALSSMAGRVSAQLIMGMAGAERRAGANIIPLRTLSFLSLADEALEHIEAPVVLELASGFSPLGVLLAREMPHATVIEVDQPRVLRDKQQRLRNARIAIPQNLTMREADLTNASLLELTEGKRPHLIMVEGLLHYLSREDILRLLRAVRSTLVPRGTLIADMSSQTQNELDNDQGFRQFRRFSGGVLFRADGPAEAEKLLREAGYSRATAYTFEQLKGRLDYERPVRTYSLVGVARA